MVDFAIGTAVDNGVGAVVPVNGCGITAAVEGAPPEVAVGNEVLGVCGCWPVDSATGHLRGNLSGEDRDGPFHIHTEVQT